MDKETTAHRGCASCGGRVHVGHTLLCERELALHDDFEAAVNHHGCKLVLKATKVESAIFTGL